jgi:hypothetical protein
VRQKVAEGSKHQETQENQNTVDRSFLFKLPVSLQVFFAFLWFQFPRFLVKGFMKLE